MIPSIDTKKTGMLLRMHMDRCGLSVMDIRNYLYLGSVQAVYHWLDGKSLPTVDNLYALSELFQVPIDELIAGNRKYRLVERKQNLYMRIVSYWQEMLS